MVQSVIWGSGKGKAFPMILVSLLGIFCFAPFGLLFSGAWQADYSVLQTIFSSVMAGYLINTLLLCIGVLFSSLFIGAMTAWFTSQYNFVLRNVFVVLLPCSIIISPYMRGLVFMEYANSLQFAWYPVLQKYLPNFAPFINQWWNFPFLVGTLTFSFFPYVYVYASALYRKNSGAIMDNARLLNCNYRSLFFAIGLPIAAPALRLGAAVVLMDTLNEYGAITYFGFPTISSAVFRAWFFYQDIGSAKFLATLVLLLVLLLVWNFQGKDNKTRYDVQQYYPTNRQNLPFFKSFLMGIFCMLWVFGGFLLPLYHFIRWAVISPVIPNLALLGSNTLLLLVVALTFGIFLAVPLAYGFHRQEGQAVRNTRGKLYGSVFHGMTMGYTIPSTVVAIAVLGFIYSLTELFPNLPALLVSKTIMGLVFAAILRFFFVLGKPIYQGFHLHNLRYENAARSLGLRTKAIFAYIALPLNMPFIFSGALLLLIEILKEIPLTLILRPFNFNTLAIHAYLLARDERIIASAWPTIFIIGIGLIGLLLFQWIEHKWKPA